MIVDELARWKANLLHHSEATDHQVRLLLHEHSVLWTTLVDTYKLVARLRNAFDPLAPPLRFWENAGQDLNASYSSRIVCLFQNCRRHESPGSGGPNPAGGSGAEGATDRRFATSKRHEEGTGAPAADRDACRRRVEGGTCVHTMYWRAACLFTQEISLPPLSSSCCPSRWERATASTASWRPSPSWGPRRTTCGSWETS